MSVNQELVFMIDQLSREKGLEKEVMVEAMKAALLTAARKRYGHNADITAHLDMAIGQIELVHNQQVVERVISPGREITLEQAKRINPEAQIGDLITTSLDVEEFGRIAAQTAKQVIVQRVREAEREMVYEEYHKRQGDLVSGMAQRHERGDLIIDLGKAEAVLPRREQNFRETFRRGERLRVYVLEVRKESRGPQIIVSRTNPKLLEKLFELEVPEIAEGIVEIKGTVREPTGRSKIAVYSHDRDVDPVGACVGTRGSRVQAIVQELHGEKIDIVAWDRDAKSFVRNALAPAKPVKIIQKDAEGTMEVVIPDDQLSLAIGKKGQNVRLAARITGWKISVRGESEVAAAALGIAREALSGDAPVPLEALTGVNPEFLPQLREAGFEKVQAIRDATDEELLKVPGMTEEYLPFLREQVAACLAARKAHQAQLLAAALGGGLEKRLQFPGAAPSAAAVAEPAAAAPQPQEEQIPETPAAVADLAGEPQPDTEPAAELRDAGDAEAPQDESEPPAAAPPPAEAAASEESQEPRSPAAGLPGGEDAQEPDASLVPEGGAADASPEPRAP
ncbi:MAG: transcription termination/antitermination protein NusA [Candidatus Tectomicrobia bacterium]|nr:transcription termination/antitermination protein NusA [Candidatus Tectomicrobia bacterium]